jgi:hypothetical protein
MASSLNRPGSVIGPQFVGEPCIAKNLSRLQIVVLMDQNPARQDTKRAFDDAHVLIKHQMTDFRAVKQRSDRRNQHDIVGPNQFPQFWYSFAGPAWQLPDACQPHRALAAFHGSFYCYNQG